MHFIHDGRKYRISFMYGLLRGNTVETGHKVLQNVNRKRVRTICEISVQGNDGTWTGIAGGYTIRSKDDPFIKAEGRFLALQDAASHLVDRGLRVAIWEAYRNRGQNTKNTKSMIERLTDALRR